MEHGNHRLRMRKPSSSFMAYLLTTDDHSLGLSPMYVRRPITDIRSATETKQVLTYLLAVILSLRSRPSMRYHTDYRVYITDTGLIQISGIPCEKKRIPDIVNVFLIPFLPIINQKQNKSPIIILCFCFFGSVTHIVDIQILIFDLQLRFPRPQQHFRF